MHNNNLLTAARVASEGARAKAIGTAEDTRTGDSIHNFSGFKHIQG